jgi:hypothetical protein
MSIDTQSLRLNPAKFGALEWARVAANRTGTARLVWVAPPGSQASVESLFSPHNEGANVWYVRAEDEAVPVGAELFATIQPEKKS